MVDKQNISICIIGVGIRGIGLLERIVSYSKINTSIDNLTIYLVDKSDTAPIQYSTKQPDYLLLNIVCKQVSVFPDSLSVTDCPPINGPDLFEWVNERKMLISDDGYTVGYSGRKIQPDDFLPRRILGEYLVWAKNHIVKQAKSNVKFVWYTNTATNLSMNKNDIVIELDNECKIQANYTFLTLGHTSISKTIKENHCQNKHIKSLYPLPSQLSNVKPKETIAIAGLGLSFYDALLSLTVGRGGRFKYGSNDLVYCPSGKEPKIIAFSNSGLPYRARPKLGAPLYYNPLVFKKSTLKKLLHEKKSLLDFDKEILPLIFMEMRIAYKRASHCKKYGWDKSKEILGKLQAALSSNSIELLLCPLDEFNPKNIYLESLLNHKIKSKQILSNSDSYQNWITNWMNFDLHQAKLGTLDSPYKSALEILREFRDLIRYSVDFGSLSSKSSKVFFTKHSQILNRIGVGPQKERVSELIALLESKILEIPLGPKPTLTFEEESKKWRIKSSRLKEPKLVYCDWLCNGFVEKSKSLKTDIKLIRNMYKQGILKPYHTANGSVDINDAYNPISENGIINKNIWILGLLNEGITFYNGYVTSPDKFIRSQYDSDKAVKSIFNF